jgi:hypothetical protein
MVARKYLSCTPSTIVITALRELYGNYINITPKHNGPFWFDADRLQRLCDLCTGARRIGSVVDART